MGDAKDSSKANSKKESIPHQRAQPPWLDGTWSWKDFSSWPLSIKFFPLLVPLTGIFIAIYYQQFFGNPDIDVFGRNTCARNFQYGFNIYGARNLSKQLATHDWEMGTAAEALLELVDPEISVFGAKPFPGGKIPVTWFRMEEALLYVQQNVKIGGRTLFDENNYTVSDPASLGVTALMIAGHWPEWKEAAGKQMQYLLNDAPRYENGAISHRAEVAELWSDAIFMVPPFLAYYAVAAKELDFMRRAVRQCEAYRDVLLIRDGPRKGMWKHIVGPSEMADDGAWSTGNAWAAYGMVRVRATMTGWKTSSKAMQTEIKVLDDFIREILSAAMATDNDESGLLRNYLGDETWFGETSGTALLAAAAYRMGVFMEPGPTRETLLKWAHEKRKAVFHRVDGDGRAGPAVNPLKHDQREPLEGASPEGESFLLLMAAAWRDCICAKICSPDAEDL